MKKSLLFILIFFGALLLHAQEYKHHKDTIDVVMESSGIIKQPDPVSVTICRGTYMFYLGAVTGGSGTTTYQWKISEDGENWSNAPGTSTGQYYTTEILGWGTVTYFRRVANKSGCSITSNSATVTVYSLPPRPEFLPYNLGADTSLKTPAMQMAYMADDANGTIVTNTSHGRVFGGRYQWGRPNLPYAINPNTYELYDGPGTVNHALPWASTMSYNFDAYGQLIGQDNNHIYSTVSHYEDWSVPQNNALWGNGKDINVETPGRGVQDSISRKYYQDPTFVIPENNPCPAGYRVPTQNDWELWCNYECYPYSAGGSFTVPTSGFYHVNTGLTWVKVRCGNSVCSMCTTYNWSPSHRGGFAIYKTPEWNDAGYNTGTDLISASVQPLLFLPIAGERDSDSEKVLLAGEYGSYWTSTVNGTTVHYMFFDNIGGVLPYHDDIRAKGMSVRCVVDDNYVPPACPGAQNIQYTPSDCSTCTIPATLTVTPDNPSSFTYQWYSGARGLGTAIVGATAQTYTATPGTYYCVITTADCGAETISRAFTVFSTISQGIPANATVCFGGTHIFNLAIASGSGTPITGYQWETSTDSTTWTPATGLSTNAHYTTPALTSNTYFRRIAKAACGEVISVPAKVTVLNGPCSPGTFPDPSTHIPQPGQFITITINSDVTGSITPVPLTFLRYNLGANPDMTPKQQMAYLGCPADMTVFGGLYQWGRKHVDHTFRCDPISPITSDLHFTTTKVGSIATDDGKFVYGITSSPYDWFSPQSTTLWGDGTFIGTSSGSNNPCPPGYRVPNEHEWALLGWEGGVATSTTGDRSPYNIITAAYPAPSGLYWVHVDNGIVTSYAFTAGNMCGYALYEKSVWESNPVALGGSVIAAGAPEPLLFLPNAGYRLYNNSGSRMSVGERGIYWSSSYASTDAACILNIYNSTVYTGDYTESRAYGASVRCVKQ